MRPHVLVVSLDDNADLLLAGPAIRAVAAGARWTTLLHGARGRAAAALLPGIDAGEEFEAPWFDGAPCPVDGPAIRALIRHLASLNVDEAAVLTSPRQSPLPMALLLRMAGIPRIAAIAENEAGSLLDVVHRPDPDLHQVERNLSLVAALGHQLPSRDTGRLAIRRGGGVPRALSRLGGFVALHPATGSPAGWSADEWRDLAASLVRRGRTVVITAGEADEFAPEVAPGTGAGRVVDLTATRGVDVLAEVLAAADVVVCDDDLPAQLAAAVGTPVAWVHGALGNPERRRPWRVAHLPLASPSVAEVVKAVERLASRDGKLAAAAS